MAEQLDPARRAVAEILHRITNGQYHFSVADAVLAKLVEMGWGPNGPSDTPIPDEGLSDMLNAWHERTGPDKLPPDQWSSIEYRRMANAFEAARPYLSPAPIPETDEPGEDEVREAARSFCESNNTDPDMVVEGGPAWELYKLEARLALKAAAKARKDRGTV